MKYVLFSFFLCMFAGATAQPQHFPLPTTRAWQKSELVDWSATKHWKIYANDPVASLSSIDSLSFLASTPIAQDDLLRLLRYVTPFEPDQPLPAFRGRRTVSFENKAGTVRKLLLSYRGGFFYDPAEDLYYKIERDKLREWQTVLSFPVD